MSENVEKRRIFDSHWQAALLLLPTMSFLFAFLYYPFVQTIWLSLHESMLLGTDTFVGLDNYIRLAGSSEYRYSFFITILWAAAVVSATLLISLVIAFLIHEVDRWAGFYLVAAIWPYALPLAVAAVVLGFVFHPEVGTLTYFINAVFGFHFRWHTDGTLALVVISVAAIWQGLGYSIIFFTAALGQIPETITEAANLDGVSRFNRLFRIYVPLISPTLVFLVVINTVGAFFGGFALVDLMTNGGPDGATNILIYKLYTDAFNFNYFGYASAQSVVLFALVGGLMYVQLKVSDKYAHYGG